MENFIHKKRIHFGAALLSVLFASLFFLFVGRFFYIQAFGEVKGEDLHALADGKYNVTIDLNASRGTIYDRNENPIAEDTPSYTVVAVLDEELTTNDEKPRHVVDPQTTAKQLAPLLNVEESFLLEQLTRSAKQVEFGSAGRDLPISIKEEIEDLELPGIRLIQGSKRFYYNGNFASHVIGFARANDDGKVAGVLGLEAMLDEQLKETNGRYTYRRDTSGIPFISSPEVSYDDPKNGNDVYLTLDRTIQTFLEDSMSEVAEQYSPERMIGIVADPKTGEILAMSTRPTFNLNTRVGLSTNWNNDAVSSRFEPGSTMKIFTLAAAIEEGVYNGNHYFQSGSYKVGPDTIRDHNRNGWGEISFDEGMQRSSNVAIAFLVEKMGAENLLNYYHAFGLNEKTGIDLPNEATSIFNYHYRIEQITTAFGQGTAITPIQQIQAATAIANNGKMMQPYIIDKIVDPNTGQILKDNEPVFKGEPVSEKTANKVLEVLESTVTSEVGTGRHYSLDGYRVALKTGTAQISNPNGPGYLSGRGEYIYSVLGMAPADNPQLIVYIAIEKPKLGQYETTGTNALKGVFNPVMQRSLQYLSVKPNFEETESASNDGVEVKSFIGKTVTDLSEELKNRKGPNIVVVGNGNKIINQMPVAGQKVLVGEKVVLLTEEDPPIPDMTGWSVRDVIKLTNLLEINPHIIGNGYAFRQSVSPGQLVDDREQFVVEFKSNRPLPDVEEEEMEIGG
ncbi:penicillin-binding protein [Sutcliffiella cohnii]